MKEIILKNLQIENFQKYKKESFDFGRKLTVIRGDNGMGKTTIYSAMTWLLFGKDFKGRTDTGRGAFDIKRKENGEKVDHVDVSVEGLFEISGVDVRLKRVLHEKWTKGAESKYSGDETLCYIDDVPKQVKEYETYVESIINETEFRMITDIHYFLDMPANEQRTYLCQMAGVKELKDFCNQYKDWETFINALNGKTIEDYLIMIRSQRKRLKEDADRIEPAIEALEKSKPEQKDWALLEKRKIDVQNNIDTFNEELRGVDNFETEKNTKLSALLNEHSKLERQKNEKSLELQKEESRLSLLEQEEANKQNAKIYELRNKNAEISKRINELTIKTDDKALNAMNERVFSLTKDREKLFADYNQLNAETFDDTKMGFCPFLATHKCDSPVMVKYLSDEKEKAIQAYNASKAEKIKRIIETGKEKGSEIKAIQDEMENNKKLLKDAKAELDANNLVLQMSTEVQPQEMTSELKKSLTTEINNFDVLIKEKNKQIEEVKSSVRPTNQEATNKRTEAKEELEKIIIELSAKSQIESIEKTINDYNEKGKKINAQIAELDNNEQTAKDINFAVVEDCKNRVNQMFSFVQWQMFELQKNGLYAEVCKPLDPNGASVSVNPGNLMNIGIDIVNTISSFRGISAPLFVDNHESVNQTIDYIGQEIDMYVAPKGTELSVEIIK